MRVLVAMWSYEANDDHSEPVLSYMQTGTYPAADSCWECFQPPVFYTFHVFLAKVTGSNDSYDIHRQMQWVNLIFSLAWVWVFLLFVRKIPLNPNVRRVSAAFILWNPRLAALSVQATNDSPVILLGACFTLLAWLWLSEKKNIYGVWFILAAGAAAVVKGNGILLLIAALPVLLLGIRTIERSVVLKLSGLLIAVVIASAFLGGYVAKYKNYGTPFLINQDKASPPPLSRDEVWFGKRAGIRSVRSGYLKFPFRSLMETPYQINDEPEFPVHRTNFWTLLYGNFYRVQFHNHPGSWRVLDSAWSHNVARILFVLGLIPTTMLIFGVFRSCVLTIRRRREIFNGADSEIRSHAFHLMMTLLFLAFILKYSYDYRDFGNIKPLFLFPAMLSMYYVFVGALNAIVKKWKRATRWILVPIFLIGFLFILDHIALLIQLYEHFYRF